MSVLKNGDVVTNADKLGPCHCIFQRLNNN